MTDNIFDFSCQLPSGEECQIDQFRGKTLLIVNTASKCGFTPQFKGLEDLYQKHKEQGLEILGFPCNQFGHQDPGSNEEITEFCQINYGVSFPMFAKVEVNGGGADPLFKHLKKEAPGALGTQVIKWNFTKFLVDASGQVVQRYAPQVKPEDIEQDIAKLLTAND